MYMHMEIVNNSRMCGTTKIYYILGLGLKANVNIPNRVIHIQVMTNILIARQIYYVTVITIRGFSYYMYIPGTRGGFKVNFSRKKKTTFREGATRLSIYKCNCKIKNGTLKPGTIFRIPELSRCWYTNDTNVVS